MDTQVHNAWPLTRDVRKRFFKFRFGFGSVLEKKLGFGSE